MEPRKNPPWRYVQNRLERVMQMDAAPVDELMPGDREEVEGWNRAGRPTRRRTGVDIDDEWEYWMPACSTRSTVKSSSKAKSTPKSPDEDIDDGSADEEVDNDQVDKETDDGQRLADEEIDDGSADEEIDDGSADEEVDHTSIDDGSADKEAEHTSEEVDSGSEDEEIDYSLADEKIDRDSEDENGLADTVDKVPESKQPSRGNKSEEKSADNEIDMGGEDKDRPADGADDVRDAEQHGRDNALHPGLDDFPVRNLVLSEPDNGDHEDNMDIGAEVATTGALWRVPDGVVQQASNDSVTHNMPRLDATGDTSVEAKATKDSKKDVDGAVHKANSNAAARGLGLNASAPADRNVSVHAAKVLKQANGDAVMANRPALNRAMPSSNDDNVAMNGDPIPDIPAPATREAGGTNGVGPLGAAPAVDPARAGRGKRKRDDGSAEDGTAEDKRAPKRQRLQDEDEQLGGSIAGILIWLAWLWLWQGNYL